MQHYFLTQNNKFIDIDMNDLHYSESSYVKYKRNSTKFGTQHAHINAL
jgi:hypothetical protein